MLVEEMIKRETDQFFVVDLDEEEAAYVAGLLDDWAMDEDVGMPLYEELRDDIDENGMVICRAEAHAITTCLEAEENWGPVYRKFEAVYRENPVLPS